MKTTLKIAATAAIAVLGLCFVLTNPGFVAPIGVGIITGQIATWIWF
jgi:hypothetical protein